MLSILKEYDKQLRNICKEETTKKLDTIELLELIEEEATHSSSYFVCRWQDAFILKHNEAFIFAAICNIKSMEKRARRAGSIRKQFLEYLSQKPSEGGKLLAKRIKECPSLGWGWFKLTEQRLMRDLNMTKRMEAYIMKTLKKIGIITSVVIGYPRTRWVRINWVRYKNLIDEVQRKAQENEEEEE